MKSSLDGISSPSVMISFINATFGVLNIASSFFVLGPDSVLNMAIIRLLLGSLYFLMALINLFKGVAGGNLNLIFSVCFGIFAGSQMLVTLFQSELHLEMQPEIFCILQIFAGLYMLALLPALKHQPLLLFIHYGSTGLGMFLTGAFVLLGWDGINIPAGICFSVFTVCSIYNGFVALIDELPEGMSLAQSLDWLKDLLRRDE